MEVDSGWEVMSKPLKILGHTYFVAVGECYFTDDKRGFIFVCDKCGKRKK